MPLTITGEQGDVRWGYLVAATVRPWAVTQTESGEWTLAGSLANADTFRVTQHPLVFVTPNGWRWPVLELQMLGASLTARLGPKEKPHVTIRET